MRDSESYGAFDLSNSGGETMIGRGVSDISGSPGVPSTSIA